VSSKAKLGVVLLAANGVICLLLLIFVWPIGITYRHRLQNLHPADVQRIQLSQQRWTDGRPEIGETVTLSDTGAAQFLTLISSAHLMLLKHPRIIAEFPVTIVSRDETFRFIIRITTNNGIYLQLGSEGAYGWNYGTLRKNSLGPFLHVIFDRDHPSSAVAARN
jgi:hypothetical protein